MAQGSRPIPIPSLVPASRTAPAAAAAKPGATEPVSLLLKLGPFRLMNFHIRGEVVQDGFGPPMPLPEKVTFAPDAQVTAFMKAQVNEGASRFQSNEGTIRYIANWWTRYYIDLNGTLAEYDRKFSAKTRSTFARKLRKLSAKAAGKIELKTFRSAAEMGEFHYLARSVKLGEYQSKILGNMLPGGVKFLDEMLNHARQDMARGYLLLCNGEPIAYLYCFALGRSMKHHHSGYDPAYSEFSPGVLLQRYALEQLFAEQRFDELDFIPGGGDHKKLFATRSVQCADVYFFRKNLMNLVPLAIHAAADSLLDGLARYYRRPAIFPVARKAAWTVALALQRMKGKS